MSASSALIPASRHHAPPLGRSVDWWGFALFIVSEAWIFLNLIAAYMYLRWLSPASTPMAIPQRELLVPGINTAVLLGSGLVAHWAHAGLAHDDVRRLRRGLLVTVVLGALFLGGQAYEYTHATFTPQSSAYGACFFTLTGLHGLHVLVGIVFLLMLLLRARAFSATHAFPVQAGTLYWHFVDAVWVVLFTLLYLI